MQESEIKQLIPNYLLNSQTYSIVITDLEGKYIFVNEVFKKRFYFLTNHFVGLPFQDSIHPDDIEQCNLAAYHCITHPNETVNVKVRKPENLKGDFYWTSWEFSLFKDKTDQPIGIICMGHDITETELASKRAKEYTQKARIVIDHITDGFFVLDRNWRYIEANKVIQNLLNLSRKEILGKNFWDFFPDSPDFIYPTQFRKGMAENITVVFEEYIEPRNAWYRTTAYPSAEGLTVFYEDITKKKLLEEKLKDSENKLRAILDSTSENNVLISPEMKVLCFNKITFDSVKEAYQKEMKEGDDFGLYIVKGTEAGFQVNFQKALSGEIVKFEKEIFFENNQGRWLDIAFYPVYDVDNKLIGVSFITINIDVRKRNEDRLAKSEYMLQAIYNSTIDAISFIDLDCKILYLNKVANEMIENVFGKTPNIGDDFLDYILPELHEEFKEHFEKSLQGEIVRTENTDGTKWYLFVFFPVYDKENQLVGVASNTRDITIRKKAELKLTVHNEKLKAIAWEQSHMVRKPIANILGLIDLIVLENNTQNPIKYLDLLKKSTQELDEIIHNIVHLADDID